MVLRLPLPYRIGEDFMPGNGDEKVKCEAGTYAWLQENCPDVPIPELYGFGLSTGEAVLRLMQLFSPIQLTHFSSLTLKYCRFYTGGFMRSAVAFSHGCQTPSTDVPHHVKGEQAIHSSYLFLEYILPSRGSMLSNTWADRQHDVNCEQRFSAAFPAFSRALAKFRFLGLARLLSTTEGIWS
ncbi:hypothetical protein BO83DRAFT_451488 [Aspergillus eucalypticola CBS 122712]|uniref:Uncharacterized protein n=1 Tax=Aspergillus eucalypticola (strain CBS 122712 / IBT 29274) TaxID=1448314 RepID=A0A317V0Q7_ASPEC|nr:uncharacterized protein BO83DRAFT_451488 [Aspergillus eucalypticola CBS 122712]PWY66961.1 hypothetical protein BO83DRAFT_451488 [Aspergillus eucalypticola CBS 122712]